MQIRRESNYFQLIAEAVTGLRVVQIRRESNFWEGEWADGKFESSANS